MRLFILVDIVTTQGDLSIIVNVVLLLYTTQFARFLSDVSCGRPQYSNGFTDMISNEDICNMDYDDYLTLRYC